jgi:hypothetical protein
MTENRATPDAKPWIQHAHMHHCRFRMPGCLPVYSIVLDTRLAAAGMAIQAGNSACSKILK